MATLRETYPLEKTKPLKKTIGKSLTILIIAIIGFLWLLIPLFSNSPAQVTPMFVFIIILAVIFIPVLTYIYQVYYMKLYFYDMKDKTLIIKKGVFSRNEITLPINRIQDVYVDQDILDRMFGLYDLHVSSATMISGALSHIDGLNKKNSDIIKEMILKEIRGKK